MIDIKRLNSSDNDFWTELEAVLAWESVSDNAIGDTVKDILHQVKTKGDDAVLEFTRRFDRVEAGTMADLEISLSRAKKALDSIPIEQRQALETAAKRVRSYHEHQKQESWT